MENGRDVDAANGNIEQDGSMESIPLDRAPLAYLSSSDYRSAMAMSPSSDQEEFEAENAAQILHKTPVTTPSSSSSSSSRKFAESNFGSSKHEVEPPSYADAIFTPYVGEGSGGGDNNNNDSIFKSQGSMHLSTSSSSFSTSDYLGIKVVDPVKIQEGASSLVSVGGKVYVTYMVVTKTNIPEYGGTDFSVRRRFRDFVTLADRLAESFRGYFIPGRPDKNVVESQMMDKNAFVEQRREALDKYLARLASHPVIRKSEELRVFLQTSGKLPLQPSIDMASRMLDGAANLPKQLFGEGSAMLAPHEAVQPAKGGRDLLRLFKELKQSVANDWGGAKPPVVEEDKEFLEKKEKLQELEGELIEASQQAEALVKGQQGVGEMMGDLGLSLLRISKFEAEAEIQDAQTSHSMEAKRLGTACVKASRFSRELNAQSVKNLDHLHEYLALMQSVHAAFADRSSALLTLQTLMTELSAMQSRIDKLNAASSKIFGGDKSKNRKVEELTDSIKTAEQSRDLAQKEYEHIKDRNKMEIERLDRNRRDDFFDMLKGFVHTQVAYSEKIALVWTKAVEEGTSI